MCRKLVVTNKLGLGSRELGWETYSLPKGEVVEFTSRQLKDAIRTGSDEVYGLKVDEETGELVFDIEGFFTTNMMQKVHINTLTPIVEDDCLAISNNLGSNWGQNKQGSPGVLINKGRKESSITRFSS